MDGHLLVLILQDLNLDLLPLEDLLTLEGPLGLLVSLGEGGSEDNLLVLELLDGFVLERNDPLVRFLQIENIFKEDFGILNCLQALNIQHLVIKNQLYVV